MVATEIYPPPSSSSPAALPDACDQLDLELPARSAYNEDATVMDEFHTAQVVTDQADSDKELMEASGSNLSDAGYAIDVAKTNGDGHLALANPNGNPVDTKRFVSPKDFVLNKVIGMGAFGKVLQVRNKYNNQVLAMKIISKRLLNRKSGYVENIRAERDILTRVKHPFVVQMHCSFQTSDKLFIIMDYLAGGELFLRLGREGIFLEKQAAFYLAEIILALNHLHSRNILHRDLVRPVIPRTSNQCMALLVLTVQHLLTHLTPRPFQKPENILLGSDGHVCLTDFGLSKHFEESGFQTEDESRAMTICGTQVRQRSWVA